MKTVETKTYRKEKISITTDGTYYGFLTNGYESLPVYAYKDSAFSAAKTHTDKVKAQ